MKKSSEDAKRIQQFRESRGWSQAKLGELFGVGQAAVSSWEREENTPPLEVWVHLAKDAPYPDRLWFWKRAGFDEQSILAIADKLWDERMRPAKPGEIVGIPRSSGNLKEGEEVGPLIPLPAEFIANPLSTRCLVIDDKLSNGIFPVGDVIILEESANNAEDLWPFHGQIPLVHLTRPKDTRGLASTVFWREGLNIGRFLFKTFRGDRLQWVATLGPFGDSETYYHSSDYVIALGSWRSELLEDKRRELEGAGRREEIKELEEEAKLQARMKMRLMPGCEILGRVVGWLRVPAQAGPDLKPSAPEA